jgi:membrane-bound lytic murein transglycosylase D
MRLVPIILIFTLFLNSDLFGQNSSPYVSRSGEQSSDHINKNKPKLIDESKLDKTTIIKRRFRTINRNINFEHNKTIEHLINYFMRDKRFMEKAVIRSSVYYPLFREVFKEEGVVEEMIHLSVIESCINPKAVSRMGATGIWQFMKYTGHTYGLYSNAYFDERKDIFESTRAAARFMKDLYTKYEDWLLVVAAYNCGPGNVNKAIRRAGGQRDIWKIYKYLPRETRGYVPSFIAMNYIMSFKTELGLLDFDDDELFFSISSSTVERILLKNRQLSLSELAKILNIDKKQLYMLNPSLKYKVMPKSSQTYVLNIPSEAKEKFYELEDSIYIAMAKIVLPNRFLHTVQRGDCLSMIASKYNCSVSELKSWNGMTSDKLRVNQTLVVFTNKKRIVNRSVPASKVVEQKYNTKFSNGYVSYIIRKGDTLYDIAKRYPGISAQNIMIYNHMASALKIRPGQKIKIPKLKS